MFNVFGRSTVSEFLGDRIVYRNLAPADPSLPALDDLRQELGFAADQVPRKTEADYARVIVRLLHAARAQDAPNLPLRRLIFVGDTRLLDGTAFENISQAGGWPGLAFIGSESDKPASIQVEPTPGGQALYLANRWGALDDFDRYCAAQGQTVDENTAVVVDLDKTAVGARGRNGQVIDQARVRAVHVTVAGILGEAFNPEAFQRAYDLLNLPEFHLFTADNQDYLAYICLVLGSGLYGLDEVVSQVRGGSLSSFRQFIDGVERQRRALPGALAEVHRDIYANVLAGDPTPFKPFRRNEYLETIGRFGCLEDGAPVEALLAQEIVLTQEVRQMASEWRLRGALLFGLSDKPDEASLPTQELAAKGFQPIHRAVTHVVGAR
jgi:hypothetical protein